MNSERWQRINDIFQAAIELRPDERPAFLLDRCAGDDSLRLEIQSLLAADDKAAFLHICENGDPLGPLKHRPRDGF